MGAPHGAPFFMLGLSKENQMSPLALRVVWLYFRAMVSEQAGVLG
jgi:hypothetical protein